MVDDTPWVTLHEFHETHQAQVLQILVAVLDEATQIVGANLDHRCGVLSLGTVLSSRMRQRWKKTSISALSEQWHAVTNNLL